MFFRSVRLCALMCLICLPAEADYIRTREQGTIEGKVVGKSSEAIVVQTPTGATRVLKPAEVLSVDEWDDRPTVPSSAVPSMPVKPAAAFIEPRLAPIEESLKKKAEAMDSLGAIERRVEMMMTGSAGDDDGTGWKRGETIDYEDQGAAAHTNPLMEISRAEG